MFDFTSSKLLILGIVALLVVGPKDLPLLLRTIGKYVGMLRRQAAEFRAQFDEAMRESELDQIKKDVESIGREAEETIREAETSVHKELHAAESDVREALEPPRTEPTDAELLSGEPATAAAATGDPPRELEPAGADPTEAPAAGRATATVAVPAPSGGA